MQFERMEIIGVMVPDLDAAMRRYSEIFGVEFEHWEFPVDVVVENLPTAGSSGTNLDLSRPHRVAIDREGLFELIEDPAAEPGIRNIHFKVGDIAAAKAELRRQDLVPVAEYLVGDLHEAVFEGPGLPGVRLALLSYDAPSAVDAIFRRGGGAAALQGRQERDS